jgi:preprotein translocase subunit SecG
MDGRRLARPSILTDKNIGVYGMKDYFLFCFILYIILVFLSKKIIDNASKSLDESQKNFFPKVSKNINKSYLAIVLCLLIILIFFVAFFNEYSIYGYILFFLLCFVFQIIYLFNLLRGLKAYQLPKKFINSVINANLITIIGLLLCVIGLLVFKR